MVRDTKATSLMINVKAKALSFGLMAVATLEDGVQASSMAKELT